MTFFDYRQFIKNHILPELICLNIFTYLTPHFLSFWQFILIVYIFFISTQHAYILSVTVPDQGE